MTTTRDLWRETRQAREGWLRVRNAEREYGRSLISIARHIGDLVKQFSGDDGEFNAEPLISVLHRYSAVLEPWARAVAAKMLADVDRRDDRAWRDYANKMGVEMRNVLRGPTGAQLRRMLEDQVDLITSLPRDAAQRVHDITFGNLYENLRGEALVEEILRTGEVTRSRAVLISRTEIARTGSVMTQIRAQSVGSTHYIWRAAHDARVRDSHRKMNGKVVAWDDPPVVDAGSPPYHAGRTFNCRCVAFPIISLDL